MTYVDYEWFLQENLSRYAGKWVAIINKTVVASGTKPAEVLKEVKKNFPKQRPLLTKIRSKLATLVLVGKAL